MYVYKHNCIYACACIYSYVYMHMYVCMHVCMYSHTPFVRLYINRKLHRILCSMFLRATIIFLQQISVCQHRDLENRENSLGGCMAQAPFRLLLLCAGVGIEMPTMSI